MILKKFKRIISILKLQKSTIICLSLFEALEMTTSILLIYMTQLILDTAAQLRIPKLYNMLPYLILLIVSQIIFLRMYLLLNIKSKSDFANNIRKKICLKEVYCNMYDKKNKNTSHFITTYNTSVDLLANVVVNYSSIIVYPISLVVAVVYFVTINPILFIASVILVPLSSHLYQRFSLPLQAKQKEIIKKRTDVLNLTKDLVDGFYTAKAYQSEDYFNDKFKSEIDSYVKLEKKLFKTSSILQRVFILLRYIPQLIIPLFGGYLAYKGYLSIGELVAATSIIFKILAPVEKILDIKRQTKVVTPACEDIEEILSYETVEDENGTYYDLSNKQNIPLQVRDLSFSFDNNKVLDNVNLKLDKNEHVIILGESGCGKSTFLKSIIGILPIFDGDITIMGIPVSPNTQRNTMPYVSYVSQNPYMFRVTIAENIAMTFFNSDNELDEETMKKIVNAAKVAQVHEYIDNLPKKYNTIINQDVKLSGGESQRIAIARGIFRNCELFLLDEPTSALDNENEMAFIEELHQVLKDKSSIIITHRKEIIKHDDIILNMIGGKLIETI